MHDIQRTQGSRTVKFPVYEYMVLFVPVAALILIVGFSFASLRTDHRIESILDDDDSRLEQINGFIAAQVSGSLNHLLAVAAESVTQQVLDSPDPSSLQSLEAAFLTLARRNPYYQQVRWIDETGQERVRVSRDQGDPYPVPRQELQNKGRRYYFTAARALLPGEVYISPVDLNVEHGQIEVPYKPVLRIAKPVFNRERDLRGIIIMNIAMRHVFDAVSNLRGDDQGVEYLLVNHEGQVLNPHKHDLKAAAGKEDGVGFTDSYAPIWERIATSEKGKMEVDNGLWAWNSLTSAKILRTMKQAFPRDSFKVDRMVSDKFNMMLIAHRPIGFVMEVRRDSRMLASLGTMLGVSIYGVSIFLYLSGHVRARRAELQAGFAIAQAEQFQRIKELDERFRQLFGVSSIGQLVVDGDGKIELANAAAEQLLGYNSDEFKGIRVDSLLPEGLRARHEQLRAQYMESPEARKMGEGRKLEALTKGGTRIPVEIGLNPYVDNGRPLVLVSIIDLSPRDLANNPVDGDQSSLEDTGSVA